MLNDLQKFLLDSNNAGYAMGRAREWIKEDDGSTTIPYEKGDWKSHDNFFGGEPYGGRIIVSYKNKPYWVMVYYGWVKKNVDANPVYEVLREALKKMPKDSPYRGPKLLEVNNFKYTNKWEGSLNNYSGEEKIVQNDNLIYKANYMGGLVDQKSAL